MLVCSGAQTGADIGGLLAAKEAGFETGGWIPKGFKTQAGPHPEYAEKFGIKEHASEAYPPRTFLNVKETDATIRFAYNFSSSGEICTLKAIKQYNKPYFDVDLNNPVDPKEVFDWIIKNDFKKINIAGNSERTKKGITIQVYEFLLEVFKLIKAYETKTI